MMKLIKLEIKISDFMHLNYFQSEANENFNIKLKMKNGNVLMSGKLGEGMAEICKQGGKI